MGTNKDTISEFRTIAGDDIRRAQHRTVVALEQSLLGRHLQPITGELLHDPSTTIIVGLTVHRTRAKVALLLTKSIGTISTESRTYWLHGNSLSRRSLLAQTARCKKEEEEEERGVSSGHHL